MTWASNLRQTAPGLRDGLEADVYWASTCLGRPLLAFSDSKPLSMHLLVLSKVANQYNHLVVNYSQNYKKKCLGTSSL